MFGSPASWWRRTTEFFVGIVTAIGSTLHPTLPPDDPVTTDELQDPHLQELNNWDPKCRSRILQEFTNVEISNMQPEWWEELKKLVEAWADLGGAIYECQSAQNRSIIATPMR